MNTLYISTVTTNVAHVPRTFPLFKRLVLWSCQNTTHIKGFLPILRLREYGGVERWGKGMCGEEET